MRLASATIGPTSRKEIPVEWPVSHEAEASVVMPTSSFSFNSGVSGHADFFFLTLDISFTKFFRISQKCKKKSCGSDCRIEY